MRSPDGPLPRLLYPENGLLSSWPGAGLIDRGFHLYRLGLSLRRFRLDGRGRRLKRGQRVFFFGFWRSLWLDGSRSCLGGYRLRRLGLLRFFLLGLGFWLRRGGRRLDLLWLRLCRFRQGLCRSRPRTWNPTLWPTIAFRRMETVRSVTARSNSAATIPAFAPTRLATVRPGPRSS